ncbi:monocarboxylate transporter-like protein [Leptotrombidium deliense]|uniref:Monocarboxylate transporter-like protein n=1 Tax=Leptotrombidium deliense TaxID=299467 RepID=A0A443SAR0_9ACAR|nr:monocarboxylate transporter-like protein [Leptotrombidium deliense]
MQANVVLMAKETDRQIQRSLNYKTDSGYSWVVVAACFVIYGLIIGNIRSFGVIFVAILDHFNVSREQASWPLSLLYAIMFFTGFGCGLVNTQLPIIINQYFVKLRGTASGFAFSGGTVGAFLLPPLVEYLLNEYSLRGCFLIVGALTMNAIPAALLLRPPISENNSCKCVLMNEESKSASTVEKLENSESVTNKDQKLSSSTEVNSKSSLVINQYLFVLKCLSRNAVYVTICVLHAVFMWSWTTIALIVVDFAVDRGLHLSQAVTLLSSFAASDLIGRMTVGYVSDKKIIERKTVAFIAILMIGLVSLITPFFHSFAAFTTISLLLGLFTGSLIILFGVLIAECVEIERVPIAIGISFSFFGFVALLRPEIIGFFRDVCNAYDGLFYGIGFVCVLTAFVWFVVININKKNSLQSFAQIQSIRVDSEN